MDMKKKAMFMLAVLAAGTMMMTGCSGKSGQPAETTAAATEAVTEAATEAPETTAAAEETTAAETTAAAEETTAAETTAAAEETAAAETTAAAEETTAATEETTAAADGAETTAAAEESAAESQASLTEGKTAVKKYTTGNLIIRSTPSKDGDKLAVVPIGTEIDVYEEGNEYVLIKYEEQEGYVYEAYLTTDQEEALQASKEYDAEQAAKAAAEKNSSSKKSSKKSKKKSSGGKKEVSRQKYDDCDGSGHGYYEITYSDGSKKIVEY